MNIVLIVLLALYVIAFLVFLWKSADIWRWYHIVLAVTLMILSIVFLAPLAGVLKTRVAWNQMFQQVEKQLIDLKAKNVQLNQEEGGVRHLQLELQKLSSESGRVWRHLVMQNVTPEGITLAKMPDPNAPVDPAAPAVAADAVPMVPESIVLYGFAEQEMTFNETVSLVPTVYLGEFNVISSTPNQVVVAAAGTPSPRQRQAIESGAAKSWSLYELLPLDGHGPFLAPGSQPSDANMFGRVDAELVESLLGNRVPAEILQAYLQDGQRVGEGGAIIESAEVTDGEAPARSAARNEYLVRWSKIKFIKDHSEDVDSAEDRGAEEGGFFEQGLAVDSRLKRDGDETTVSFESGDEVYVPYDTAISLRDQGIAEILVNHSVRRLNDYRFILRRTELRLDEVRDQIAQQTKQKKILEETMAQTDAMNQQFQVTKNHLESDNGQLIRERTAVDQYSKKLEQELDSSRKTLAELYRLNQQLSQELTSIHTELAELIEERVEAAAAE